MRTAALRTTALGPSLNRVEPRHRLPRQHRLHQDFQTSEFAQRRLFDDGDGGPMSRTRAPGKDPLPRGANTLQVRPHVPHEDGLGYDRVSASAAVFQGSCKSGIDQLGLPAGIRDIGRGLTVDEEFADLRAIDPAKGDDAFLRIDHRGTWVSRHAHTMRRKGLRTVQPFEKQGGATSWTPRHPH